MPAPSATRTRIVILGGGYAGAYCAQALERELRRHGLPGVEVVLIDRQNYFVFFPLLVEAGTGSLEPRHAVVSIRSFLRTARFKMAEVTGVDLEERVVLARLAETGEVEREPYDHLVIALGSVTRMPEIPGLREHGLELKSLANAVEMRDHAIRMLEVADSTDNPELRRELLHFVVVGANFTGVEVAGELEAVVKRAARKYRGVGAGEIGITLVERTGRILPALDEELGEYAAANLRKRGVEIRLNSSLAAMGRDFAEIEAVSGGGGAPGSESWGNARPVAERRVTLRTRTVIWCAGIAPTPLTLELGVARDERGYIVCERDLRVRGLENIWAIGDCAVNIDGEGRPYPATAQHAVQQGKHLARNIALAFARKPTLPCDIVHMGSLAALGCRTGVAKVFGLRFSGFAAWWLWRTVYLLKMPGWGRRVRVALDWTLDLFFRRDFVQLGAHRREPPRG